MSYKASNWARVQRLHKTPKTVLTYLADRANEKQGYYCYPSQATIAAETGLSERTVRMCLKYLTQMGFIEREGRRRKDGYRTSDTITVLVSDDELCAQPYGEWYAENGSHRQPTTPHRQPTTFSPAGAAGPNQKEELEVQREGTSTDTSTSTTSGSSSREREVTCPVTREIIRRIPTSSNDFVFNGHLECLLREVKDDLTQDQIADHHALMDALALEAAKRFGTGGVS